MDSDSTHLNDNVSPEFIAVMRKVADHYYGTPEIHKKHLEKATPANAKALRAGQINYSMVNDLFKSSAYFGTRKYEGIPTDIKLTLGTFSLTKDKETGWYRAKDGSYKGHDVYDFANNADFLKEYAPEVTETLLDMGMPLKTIHALYDTSIGQAAVGIGATLLTGEKHPAARMFGGIFMSDKKHLGEKADPSTDGTQFITFDIPAEDAVAFERPSPRPLWFEDENIEPVFPNTPMDEERKGMLDTFLSNVSDIFISPAEAEPMNDSPPSMQKEQMVMPTPAPERPESGQTEMSFGEAFANNRAAGNDEFTWRGNRYTTELADGS